MQNCNGICKDYSANWCPRKGSWRIMGYKRCSICCIVLNVTVNRCPCCNTKLKTKPQRLNESMVVRI